MDHRDRRNLKVAVACMLRRPNFAKELTGTVYADCPRLKEYTKPRGTGTYNSMSSSEYIDFLENALKHFGVRRNVTIVHDRSRIHQGKVVAAWCAARHIEIALLPPRSPDLDPLDYGMFGTCKTKLCRYASANKLTWNARCIRFLEMVRAYSMDAAIQQMPRRLSACIQAGGKHFDRDL
jgi:hypothetical protein